MRFAAHLVLTTLFQFAVAHADIVDNGALQNRISPISNAGTPATTDFLPVHEAYRLTVEVQPDKLQLNWDIADGYYLYGEQFRIGLTHNQQDVKGRLQSDKGEITYDNYFEKEVEKFRIFTTQTLALPDLVATQDGSYILSTRFQGCADAGLCYPPETLYFSIDFASLTATPTQDPAATIQATSPDKIEHTSFAVMLGFALLGGLILNLMPCVFPVLSIKLLGFARSNQSDSHVREHSWFYTLGVLSTFLLTALLLMALRHSGSMIGWGYQLQSPVFVAILALLFVVLALSMSDFITLGSRLMGIGQQLTAGNHYRHSFFTGVLAVIVASPCSVPFMGVALGYAMTQPPMYALVIFGGLGLGLASPFLVFAYLPWLIQHLPKPGPWMQTFKHWLALPLYLSTLWLLWVLWHQLIPPAPTANNHAAWETYSSEKLDAYLERREAVFVELTADWCITCLVNEKTSLSRPAVLDVMKRKNIHYLRGDWTNRDPEITTLLKQYQRAGVPLYLYYRKDQPAIILPQLLTEKIIVDSLSQ